MSDSHTLQETESMGIHNVFNAQNITGRFKTRSAIDKFSNVTESFTAKETDGLTFFFLF